MASDFPQTRAAMAAFEPAFKAAYGLGFQPGSDRPAERSAWREKHDAEEAAQAAVVTAYATEMLPAILGGTWRKTNSQITVRKGQYYVEWPASYCRVLFDHPLHYRTSASLARRGKATWGNTVIVGRPYATFDEAGHLRDEAAQNAQDRRPCVTTPPLPACD